MKLTLLSQKWPIDGSFTISRGARTEIEVVYCALESVYQNVKIVGHGECVPYAHYGESVEGVMAEIKAVEKALHKDFTCHELQKIMPAGAARNALDCALWDLACKCAAQKNTDKNAIKNPVEENFGTELSPLVTAYTLSVDTYEKMAQKAFENKHRKLLKLKFDGKDDIKRMEAIRAAVPNASLIVDANEAWQEAQLESHLNAAKAFGISMIEQPLPAGNDGLLAKLTRKVPIFADEALHTIDDLPALKAKYDGINIKLDKAGGLTQALALKAAAKAEGFEIMVGCMLATSLAMAPAYYLAHDAQYVDLDGPLLLARDREHAIFYDDNHIFQPPQKLWG